MNRRTFVKTAACGMFAAALPTNLVFASEEAAVAFTDVLDHIDVSFSQRIQDAIAACGDNPDVGNRSAGSAAEREAGQIIMDAMNEIGLANVTADTFTCDNWSFEKARLYLPDGSFIALGGFATQIECDREEFAIVDGGRGTDADLADLDVEGKLVLITIDQHDDWWINHPAYQAHLYGAKAVIACNTTGYAQYDDDTVGSQDICGPDYAPALAISKNGYNTLLELIEQGGGEATVELDCVSRVEHDGTSANIWGEIVGTTNPDEVILLGAHYDGYYHSFYDDASGCAIELALAKAIIESGYQPSKTIRFVFHGAEEWGVSNCESDWAKGSYEQITNVHPEWAEKTFALLNIDDMFSPMGETRYLIRTSHELLEFTVESAAQIIDSYPQYEVVIVAPTDTGTDQFNYVQHGIVCVDAGMDEPDLCYYKRNLYHTNRDAKDPAGFDLDAFAMVHQIFAKLLVDLDALAVRPVLCEPVFTAAAEELDADVIGADHELFAALEQARQSAAALDARLADLEPADAAALNVQLHELYAQERADLVSWDWSGNVVLPTTQAQTNVAVLAEAIASLENGDGDYAYDECLWQVDYNWYAYDFSREAYEFQVARVRDNAAGTWGEGLILRPNQDLYDAIAFLGEHYEEEGVDYTDVIAALNDALAAQQANLQEIASELAANLQALAAQMDAIA